MPKKPAGLAMLTLAADVERRLLWILAAVQFTATVDFIILMPLGPQLMRSFAIGPHQFGLLVSSYTFCAAISGLLAALGIDRYDRKNVFLLFYAGFTVGTLACAFSPTYEALLASRAITGLFGGVLSSLILALVSDAIPYERRGGAMGKVATSYSAATILGLPFGLFAAERSDWHAPFLFLGVFALVLCGGIVSSVPKFRAHIESSRTPALGWRTLLRCFSDREQARALAMMAAITFGHFAIVPYVSPSIVANANYPEADLPFNYIAGGLLTVFTSPFIGRASDRIGKSRAFMLTALLALVPYWLLTHLSICPTGEVLGVCALFFVCSSGRNIPASALISGVVSGNARGSFMSVVSCVQQLSSAAASYFVGRIVARGPDGRLLHYEKAGYVAIGLTLVAIYFAGGIRESRRP